MSLCCSRANSKNKQCITDLSTIMKICPSLYSVCSIHALRLNLDVSFGSSCVLHGSLPFFTLHAAYYFYWRHTFLAWTCSTSKVLFLPTSSNPMADADDITFIHLLTSWLCECLLFLHFFSTLHTTIGTISLQAHVLLSPAHLLPYETQAMGSWLQV